MFPGMRDYLSQATLGTLTRFFASSNGRSQTSSLKTRSLRQCALDCQRRTPGSRTYRPPDHLSAMAWIVPIIESPLIPVKLSARQNVVATVKRNVLRGSRNRKLGE